MLLCLLYDRIEAPAFAGAQRAGLDDTHGIADATLVVLVMRHELLRLVEVLLVELVSHAPLDLDGYALLHLVGDDHARTDLAMRHALLRLGRGSLPGWRTLCVRTVVCLRVETLV